MPAVSHDQVSPDSLSRGEVSFRVLAFSRVLLATSVILAFVACAALLVYGSGRGLDLTDEIFYLTWARDPQAYALMYQPFGYLLHPLFGLVGEDLVRYRLAGFAITAGAGAYLGLSVSHATYRPALFAIYGAASALTIFFPWIITPSYNSAANVGAMLIIAGLFNIGTGARRAAFVGALATATGLTIAAFSKPPLLGLAVVLVAVLAWVSRKDRTPLLGSIVLAAALTFLFIAPLEIPGVVRRILETQHILALPNTPAALPAKAIRDLAAVPLPLCLGALAAISSFALARTRVHRWPAYAAIACGAYYVATILPDAVDGSIPDFLGFAIATIAAGYAGVVQKELGGRRLVITLLFAAPVAVGLGTFNNQWFQLNFSMAFPFLVIFFLASLDPARWRRTAACALATTGPVLVLLLAAWAPYSLPAPIFDQQTAITVPIGRGEVKVDDETATFARAASGLARGALVIDLSGTGPGVAVLLGGQAPVLAWLNPATPTWPDVVWNRLAPQQRSEAWFVVPPWPEFRESAPARWLREHRRAYCRIVLPDMTFWSEERSLELWRPCKAQAADASARGDHPAKGLR